MENSCNASPPDGIIYRPPSGSGRGGNPLLEWQSVPFEILNPDHASSHVGTSLPTPLGFRRSDQDLMFQSHPSIFAPIQFPLSDLADAGDTTSLYPLSPASGSDETGDGAVLLDEKQSIQAMLSNHEQLYSGEGAIVPIDDKTGFWDTVMCSPSQGKTTTIPPDQIFDFLPSTSPPPVPFQPPSQAGPSRQSSPPKPFPPFLPTSSAITKTGSTPERTSHPAKPPVVVDAAAKDAQDRPYECSQCGLRFRKRCNAINHTKIVHEKLRPYKCSYCDRAFGKKSNCQKHEKLHTSSLKFGQRGGALRQSQLQSKAKSKAPNQVQLQQEQLVPPMTEPIAQNAPTVTDPRRDLKRNTINTGPGYPKLPEPRSPDGVLSLLGDFSNDS